MSAGVGYFFLAHNDLPYSSDILFLTGNLYNIIFKPHGIKIWAFSTPESAFAEPNFQSRQSQFANLFYPLNPILKS